jgi:hypothetical protein
MPGATREHGPLFDGRAPFIVDYWLGQASEHLADEGVRIVHQRLHEVLRHPTGHYESRVVKDRSFGDVAVTDSGVVYGPWLEGTGSRNRTTRFKGYATFRRAAQELEAREPQVIEHDIREMVRGLGGGAGHGN